MATTFAVLVFLLAGFSTKQVHGYYCDSDKCGVDKYCCGVNICCTSYAAWQLWYFWCGIVFFIFLLSACACFCRYRYYHTAIIVHQHSNPYSRLDHSHPDHHHNQYPGMPVTDGQYGDMHIQFDTEGNPQKYNLHDYPPPTYTQSTGLPEKDPNHCR